MPSINHKRKTSKKSKSSKRSKNANRNKKTRSNMRKMSGGANIGDKVYSKITGSLLGTITSEGERVYGIKPIKTKNRNYVIKPTEELDWSTIEPNAETLKLTKNQQTNKAKVGHFAYDMSNRIIGKIVKKNNDSFSIQQIEILPDIKYIMFDKSTEGLYWYPSIDYVNINGISTYEMRLDDANIRVKNLKHSTQGNATKSIKRSIKLGYNSDNIDVDNESQIEMSQLRSQPEGESYA